jgi:hypothetical protein
MTTPKIQALGLVCEPWSMRWKASGYVDGIGWLEARGRTLIEAMEALQALAAGNTASVCKPSVGS